MAEQHTFVAFLRGINVGGHHKVPMAQLRGCMEAKGYRNVKTLLNSGNVIFDGMSAEEEQSLASKLERLFEQTFGFPVPVLVRKAEDIFTLIHSSPFEGIEVTKDTRLYVSFAKESLKQPVSLPWVSDNSAYRILQENGGIIYSMLDLSVTNTVKGMETLEKFYGKNITTRNWNTLLKIADKMS